jgi:hypothetical protein
MTSIAEDDDVPWEGPLCECPQCEDLREQDYCRDCERRAHERAVAKAWDEAHAEDAARQGRPHD